jgi:GNAT superfamily N-acetyltransferase
MTPTSATFTPATAATHDAILAMMQTFYAHERISYDGNVARAMLQALDANPVFGSVHLIQAAGQTVGYLIVTLGFSVEFGGRYLIVDELFLREEHRGRGYGMAALAFAEELCRRDGIRTLRLEVNHDNTKARDVYARAGYFDQERHLLTKRLP